jgi:hypothetical protein
MEWNDKLKARDTLIFPQFDESFAWVDGLPTGWNVEIAKDKFLSLSSEQRRSIAKDYYAERVEGLAREGYYDTEALRNWFIQTATLSLEQAPIKGSHPFHDDPTYAIRYRNIPFENMPRMQIWRVFLVKEIPLLAMAASLVTTFGFALCFFMLRWIARGFRATHQATQ